MAGAQASAAIYSIVITAKAYGLDVEGYLAWVLSEMPARDFEGTLDPKDFLPWSDQVPRALRTGDGSLPEPEPVIDADPCFLDEVEAYSEEIERM